MMNRIPLVAAALALLCTGAAQAASSDEVQVQLQAMQDRMNQMEDQLQATTDQLSAANQRIESQQVVISRVEEDTRATSGLASFLDTLEIGGWMSASYFYNFNDPDGVLLPGSNTGGFAYPFRPDANSFSLDQFWLELERPVNEENRAGFRADIVYGKTSGLTSGNAGADGFSGNDFDLYQGYIQYLAPMGEGVEFKFGKFATTIGAEVAQAPQNFNITRGHVYNLFQPITHTGILASTNVGGADVSLGFVNETRSFPAADIDLNKDKAVIWSVGSGNEVISWSFNGTYGASDSGQGGNTPAGDRETILDLILTYSPSDQFTTYVNADYIDSENSWFDGEFDGYGISWGSRYAFTERTGGALRLEYVDLDFDQGGDFEVWGITTTVDHALTEQLMLRGEVRYDNVADGGDPFVDEDMPFGEDDQITAGVEVIYSF
jgi:hypothetical protein